GRAGLEIWGVNRHSSSEYERLEGLASSSTSIGIDYLRVACLRPGRLDVDLGDARVASFAAGRIVRGGAGIFSEQGPIYRLLVGAGQKQGDNSYLEAVQRIAWSIRSMSHGGTLVFLPDHDPQHLKLGKYEPDPRSRATNDLRDRGREYRKA